LDVYVVSLLSSPLRILTVHSDYLSIPSFKWYSAAPLDKPRMTLTCVTYGRQIFGIGGRLAWADDSQAGCYDTPAFIYDAQSEVTRTSFDVSISFQSRVQNQPENKIKNSRAGKLTNEQPALSLFSLSSSTASDIKASPTPSSWADPTLRTLFWTDYLKSGSGNTTTDNGASSTSDQETGNKSDSTNKGAIAGGVVGGVAGLALIMGLLWFFIARRKKQKTGEKGQAEVTTQPLQPMPELPSGTRDGRSELGSDTYMHAELPAHNKREVSELDIERNR
jgi:hypothetical protein